MIDDHKILSKWECTIAAVSKASAASWQRPVACSLQPACKGEGWWLKGFSASGTTCISEASSVSDWPAQQCKLVICTGVIWYNDVGVAVLYQPMQHHPEDPTLVNARGPTHINLLHCLCFLRKGAVAVVSISGILPDVAQY